MWSSPPNRLSSSRSEPAMTGGERWLLDASEAAATLHPLDRALLLLRLGGVDRAAQENPADWPLARRERALLALSATLFGDRLECVAHCPACAALSEFDLSARALGEEIGWSDEESLEIDGYLVRLRPLSTRDLATVAARLDGEQALVQCAVAAVRAGGKDSDFDALPEEVRAAIVKAVEQREAEGEALFELACSECGHAWSVPFDIGAHLWERITGAARRVVGEVATLARVFGWRENDVLAIPRARRRLYLEAAQ
jgi:hypothetical protein